MMQYKVEYKYGFSYKKIWQLVNGMSTNDYFINLIYTYLWDKKPADPAGIDLSELLNTAEINKVSGIVYTQLQRADANLKTDENYQKAEQYFLVDLMHFNRRNRAKEQIIYALKNHNIRFAFFKGSVLCDYYREPTLRTMGDLDILIDGCNKDSVHNIMLGLGAKYYHDKSQPEELKYSLNKTLIEIHTKLICDEVVDNGVDYEGYFADEINNMNMIDECLGQLKPERHVIFMITHMARHFSRSGCGIRMFMDIHIVKKHYGDELNWKYILNELKKLNLAKFTNCVCEICNKWFDSGFECENELTEKQLSRIEQFIIEAGTFGTTGRNTDAMKVKQKGAFGLAFPTYKDMRQCSKWFADKPAVLLPIAYIERIVRNAKERGGIIRWIIKITSGRAEVENHGDIMDIIGL